MSAIPTAPSLAADVLVIGAGNAALCSAMAAVDLDRRVVVLEKAPAHARGGNSYLTGGGIRFAYEDGSEVADLVAPGASVDLARCDFGAFPRERFCQMIMDLGHGRPDSELVSFLVDHSLETMRWLRDQGLLFEPATKHAFDDGGVLRFTKGECLAIKGGGPGLSDMLFDIATSKGVSVLYATPAVELIQEMGRVRGAVAETPAGLQEIRANAVVMASGGFEANAEMRRLHLGAGWENAKVRGVPYNTGDGLRMAQEVGAQRFGAWDRSQTVAIDAHAPLGERGKIEKANRHGYCWGVMVNKLGRRFVDEGANFHNFTFSTYGSLIVEQPDQIAFQIFDQKTLHLLRTDHYKTDWATVATSDSLDGLARLAGIDPVGLQQTVRDFNRSCPVGTFDPTRLDGLATVGLDVPKSNWALPLDQPPFVVYPVVPGVSFTYGGLRIDSRAQVLDGDDRPIDGLYAAGELVGGLFYFDYPSGTGLMSGSVFGRTAGTSAALASA